MKKWRVVVARGKKVRRKFSWLPEQRLSKPQTTSTTRQTKFLIFTETCQGFSFASVQSTGMWCWQQAKHRPEYLPPSPWWAIYRVGPTLHSHPPVLLIQSGRWEERSLQAIVGSFKAVCVRLTKMTISNCVTPSLWTVLQGPGRGSLSLSPPSIQRKEATGDAGLH